MSRAFSITSVGMFLALLLSPSNAWQPAKASSQSKSAVNLAIMPLNGGNVSIVALNVDRSSKPSWSPNSDALVFLSKSGSIYTVQRSVRNWDLLKPEAPAGVKKIREGADPFVPPAWSTIYGILYRHTDGQVWRVKADGSGAGPLALTAGIYIPNVRWLDASQDGTMIAFETADGDLGVYNRAFEVTYSVAKAKVTRWYCVNPKHMPNHLEVIRDEKGKCPICDSELVPLERLRYTRICFSPNSRAVAFQEIHETLHTRTTRFYRAKIDGSNRTLLATYGSVENALYCWGGNGDELVVSQRYSDSVFLKTMRATEPLSPTLRPCGPQDTNCWNAAVSPDGNWIAFLTTKEPMTLEELRNALGDVISDPVKIDEPPKTEPKEKKPWVVEPDARATGRFGLLITPWIQGTSSGHQRIYVYLPGKRDKDEYHEDWKTEHRLFEGEYDVMVNGMVLEKVPIKPGHATRILLGALKFTGSFSQQLVITDAKSVKVRTIQGGETVSLPIGEYNAKIGTRTVKVEIKEGETSEF